MSLPRRLIVPKRHPDERGWFAETFHEARLRALGIDCRFVQDNQSYSQRAATLRGLHFQAPPFEQAKLISVLRGRVFDVAVDVRRGSPTFGQHDRRNYRPKPAASFTFRRERINQANEEIVGFASQKTAKDKEIGFIEHELTGVRDLYQKNLVPITEPARTRGNAPWRRARAADRGDRAGQG